MQQKAFQRQALQNHQPPVKREDSPYLHQSECGLWITETPCNMSHSRDMTAGSFAGDWRRLKEPSCWYPRVCGDTLTREGQTWLGDIPHTLLNSFQFYSILLFLSCGLCISCLLLSWGIPIDAFWVWRAGVSIDYETIRYLGHLEKPFGHWSLTTKHSTTTFFLPCSTCKYCIIIPCNVGSQPLPLSVRPFICNKTTTPVPGSLKFHFSSCRHGFTSEDAVSDLISLLLVVWECLKWMYTWTWTSYIKSVSL